MLVLHSFFNVQVIFPTPHSPADGYLRCFYLTVVNSAAVNISVQVFVWAYVLDSLENIPRSGIAGPYSSSS